MRIQGFRGNCDSQGKLGMCPSLAESLAVGFSRNHVSRETLGKSLQLFHRNSCKITDYRYGFTRRGGLVRPASKSSRFSHHPIRVPQGFRYLRFMTGNTALRETDFQRPAKGGSTPAFACQRAAIAPLPCLNLQPYFSSFNFV